MNLFLGNLAHLLVPLLTPVQQALRLIRVGEKSVDCLPIVRYFFICGVVQVLFQV